MHLQEENLPDNLEEKEKAPEEIKLDKEDIKIQEEEQIPLGSTPY